MLSLPQNRRSEQSLETAVVCFFTMIEEFRKDSEGKLRLYIYHQCDNPLCGKWHWKQKRFLKERNYCCSACGNVHRNIGKSIDVSCALCGKIFRLGKFKSTLSKSGLHFCCREHKDIGQRIENGMTGMWPDHYGSENVGLGYREIAFRNYPAKCNRCGYSEVEGILEVHHKNRNRLDRSLENLEILCPNCHQEEHFRSKDGRFSLGKYWEMIKSGA